MRRAPLTALTAAVALTLSLGAGAPAALATTAPGSLDESHGYTFAELADDAQSLTALDAPATQDWNAATAPDGGTGRTGWFGEAWSLDEDGNGCDTRNDILARDLTDATLTAGSSCEVATGYLEPDIYTGDEVRFVRSHAQATVVDGVTTQPDSQVVQLDHLLPLSYVYAHGAWAWSQETRLSYANDPLVLVAVDGQANNAKGDSLLATSPTGQTKDGNYQVTGGGGWQPATAFRCAYDARIVIVAIKYQAGLAQADADTLTDELTDCAAQDPTTSYVPATVQAEAVSATEDGSTPTTQAPAATTSAAPGASEPSTPTTTTVTAEPSTTQSTMNVNEAADASGSGPSSPGLIAAAAVLALALLSRSGRRRRRRR